jgi:hypothetical protein
MLQRFAGIDERGTTATVSIFRRLLPNSYSQTPRSGLSQRHHRMGQAMALPFAIRPIVTVGTACELALIGATREVAHRLHAVIAPRLARLADPYRPERHYMRGPGPKWRQKHGIASRGMEPR